jgi:hypothetical protein
LIEFVFAADGDVVSTVLVHLPCLVGDVIKHPPGRNEDRGGGREKVGVREEKGGRREDDRFCYLYSARKTKYVLNYFTPLEYSHHRRRAHNTKIDMIVHHSTFHVFDVIVKMYHVELAVWEVLKGRQETALETCGHDGCFIHERLPLRIECLD